MGGSKRQSEPARCRATAGSSIRIRCHTGILGWVARRRNPSIGWIDKQRGWRKLNPSCETGDLQLPLDQLALGFGDCLGRIEALGTGLGAIHDGMAAVEPERILECIEPLAALLVARVVEPARRLQQRRRSEEAVRVPPITRARRRAACAQNAFVEAVELDSILMALPPLFLRRRTIGFEPGFDRGVLSVEVGQV